MMAKKQRIGLVMKSLQAEFFQEMKKGAIDFASKQSMIELITVGTNTQTEIGLQVELVDALIRQEVDAIVLVPIDSQALVPVVVKAVKSGIKVVNIDIKLDHGLLQQNGIEIPFVGPDNESAAEMVGDVLSSKLKPGAPVVLIEGLNVAENAQQRKRGFLKSISKYKLNLVDSESADWETAKAEKVFQGIFTRNPEIGGVFCCNDAMAIGVIKILEHYGRIGKVQVVGFDNDASVQSLLNAGVLLATIDAFGSKMAVRGIEFALKLLDGIENPGSYNTGFVLVQAKS
jgi:ribose transport system substrate-binding protein